MNKYFLLFLVGIVPWSRQAASAPPDSFEPTPPPDKELLARIEALPDHTWMKLPAVKTAGELKWPMANNDYRRRGPMVRDYCNRMVWAPERQRALYCGAGHNIHPFNDVWEYDLASNTWICLYAPDPAPPRDAPDWYRANVVLKDGVVRTPRGGPVRPAHTWGGLCYDSDRKRLVFWDAHKGIMFSNYQQLGEAVGLKANDPLLRLSGSGPGEAWVFTFDPESRRWQEVLTGAPKAYESSQLEYLPERRTFWLHSGKTYVLPPGERQWKQTAADGPGQGVVSACDPASRTVVACGKRAFVYSCDNDQWIPGAELPGGETAYIPASVLNYDSAARRYVLCTAADLKNRDLPPLRLWLYDLATDQWSRPEVPGAVPATRRLASYYDPARNVTVLYDGSDVWVYRCKKR
jgi:hypothetical protein